MKFAEFVETVDPAMKKLLRDNDLHQCEKTQDIVFGLFDRKIDPVLNLL